MSVQRKHWSRRTRTCSHTTRHWLLTSSLAIMLDPLGEWTSTQEKPHRAHSKPGLCTYHTKDDLLHLSPTHRAQCCCSHKILKAQHTSGSESPQQVQYQLIADDLMKRSKPCKRRRRVIFSNPLLSPPSWKKTRSSSWKTFALRTQKATTCLYSSSYSREKSLFLAL